MSLESDFAVGTRVFGMKSVAKPACACSSILLSAIPERPHIEHVDVEALLQHAHSADDLPGQCQPAPAVVPALAHQCRRCCRRRRRCCNRRLLRELFNVVVAEQRHHREGGV